MLPDRSYLRSDYPRRNTSAVVWLIAALVAAFVMELLLMSPVFGATGTTLVAQLTLNIRSLQSGHLWTLLTHSFLHSTGNPLQILFTILGLVFIGRELEPLMGARKFLSAYGAAILAGALCWTAVHWTQGGVHLGASAGVLGLFTVLVCLNPNQEMRFLLLFLFPVTLRPKYIGYGLLVLNIASLFFFEIPGHSAPFGYSPSVHLGGMLAGWLYFRYFHANNGPDRASTFELPVWLRRNERAKATVELISPKPSKPSVNLRAEVDLILDKINSHGFSSLTDDEKRILDEAKDLLSRP